MGELTVITGRAYQRRATLEVAGDTLTWRAQRLGAEVPENIVTTVHDVRDAHLLEQRFSVPGAVLACAGVVWSFTQGLAGGALAAALGLALVVWRRRRPRQFLMLDVGDRRLVLDVALPSAAHARALVGRIDRAIASGEAPASPPTLP